MNSHSYPIVKKGVYWKFLNMAVALLLALAAVGTESGQKLNANEQLRQEKIVTIIPTSPIGSVPAWPGYEVSTVDSSDDVGQHNAITIGTDGLGLISYFDDTNDNLKVAHCNDLACKSAAVATLDSVGFVGQHTSIAMGTDGRGLISYKDTTNDNLKVAHCNNQVCSSAAVATIDSGGSGADYTSIAIGTDGLGLISYWSFGLKVAHCNNQACSSATIATLDGVGGYTAITIGSDGLGLISYTDESNGDLKVAHCNNLACSSASITTLDSVGSVGWNTSITIGTDGRGLISYYDLFNDTLKVAHCNNLACSAATLSVVSGNFFGGDTSITIGSDGFGLISYLDSSDNLIVAHCDNLLCSSATSTTIDNGGTFAQYTAITLGADGLALISYWDFDGNDLKIAHEINGNIYLPTVLRNYCSGFAGPTESEPNDLASQANGPLCSGYLYSGDPDRNGSGQDSDYYYIDLATAGTITVEVNDFLTVGQVQLYYQTTSDLKVTVADQPSGKYSITYPGNAGRYYIRVVAPAGHPTGNGNYSLQVSYP